MALLRNITRGLGAIPREREPGLFNLPFRPPSIQTPITPPVNIGGPALDISQIPTRAPIDPKLIDYGFGPGIMPPLPDDFGIPINPIAPPPVNIGGPPLDTSLISPPVLSHKAAISFINEIFVAKNAFEAYLIVSADSKLVNNIGKSLKYRGR